MVVTLVAATVLLPGWFLLEAEQHLAAKRQALITELPPLLASDEARARALLESPLFDPPTGDDAGPLLNARLAWEGVAHTPLVPERCQLALRRAGTAWQQLPRADVDGCDAGWLHELRRFGRWSLSAGHREQLPAGPRTEFGLPDLGALQDLAKLHLLLADDAEQAAQDVRHLAHLFFTHEYLLSAVLGVALLSIEEKAWESSEKRWSSPPLTKDDREFLRTHLVTATFAINPLAPASLSTATVEALPRFRRCLLVTEQAFMQTRTELPAPEQCLFEHARWELAHPLEQPPAQSLGALSGPARAGALVVEWLAPERFAALAGQLDSADGLPAAGRWSSRQSERHERLWAR